jgi:formiminoglutamase
MCAQKLPHDDNWPRANTLFTSASNSVSNSSDLALIGIPAHKNSLSPTSAHLTPIAIRDALARYSTFAGSTKTDLSRLTMVDLGDIADPDFEAGEAKVAAVVENLLVSHKVLVALGGDNSITYSLARGLWKDLSKVGLITFDAHHDLRDGKSNGSPVWRLIQAGLPGKNIVQIGISDFANSLEYSKRAEDNGITVINRAMMRNQSMEIIVSDALAIAGANGREIYVDVDVDVCDRTVAPACPASVPGGITADELRNAVRLVAKDSRVRSIDITEIDVALDTPDQRTIRLAALLVLETAAGVASR